MDTDPQPLPPPEVSPDGLTAESVMDRLADAGLDTPDRLAASLLQTEDSVQSRQQKRLNTAFQVLKTDRLEVTYEIEAIRKTEQRLEGLLDGSAPELEDPTYDRQPVVEHLQERLRLLREGQENSIASENPCFPVVLVKPTVVEKENLGLIERKTVAEEARIAYVEHAPLFRESLREALRTTTVMDGLANTEDEISAAVKGELVDMLMGLEGRREHQVRNVSDFDPELKLSDDEEESIAPVDTLEPAEMAESLLNQERRRRALLEKKRESIIKARLVEAAEHREDLMDETTDQLIEKITQVEILNVAVNASRQKSIDYWLLSSVRDATKPLQGYARGVSFTKGWEPFFASVEEVRDVRDGLPDFYNWLIEQRGRLDTLTEEDLYALSAYGPFREVLRSLHRAGGEPDSMAPVSGLFS
jgi:hypothetical protein